MSVDEYDKFIDNINNNIPILKVNDIKISMNNSLENDDEILNCVINQEHSHYLNSNEINNNSESNANMKISGRLSKITVI